MNIKFVKKTEILKILPFLLAALMIIIQIFILFNTVKIIEFDNKESAEEVIAVSRPFVGKDALYCLYECGGKIGIYDAKSSILIDIINVYTTTLPKSDQLLLKNGIEIFSFTELSNIIDDFSS